MASYYIAHASGFALVVINILYAPAMLVIIAFHLVATKFDSYSPLRCLRSPDTNALTMKPVHLGIYPFDIGMGITNELGVAAEADPRSHRIDCTI